MPMTKQLEMVDAPTKGTGSAQYLLNISPRTRRAGVCKIVEAKRVAAAAQDGNLVGDQETLQRFTYKEPGRTYVFIRQDQM